MGRCSSAVEIPHITSSLAKLVNLPMGFGDVWWACEWIHWSKSWVGLVVNRKKLNTSPTSDEDDFKMDVAMWGACKIFFVIQVDMQCSWLSRMCQSDRGLNKNTDRKPGLLQMAKHGKTWQNDRGSHQFCHCSFGKRQILIAIQILKLKVCQALRKIWVVSSPIWCFLRVTCNNY